MADIFEIAGRVHSTSQEGVVTVANEILDSSANKKQSQINSEVETRLNAYETGKFVNVDTYAELPASGEVDTIYRVANWDGEQVDTTKYAEYSWDGTQYVLLGVNKNDDVIRTDVSQSLSDAEKKQARENIGMGNGDFAVASDFTNPDATKRAKVPTVGAIVDGLNDGIYDVSKRNPTGGPNSDGKFTLEYILNNANTLIPTGWRHGGMTISFVDSSDNKYVQYRLMSDTFNTTPANWQGISSELTATDKNIATGEKVFAKLAIIPLAYTTDAYTTRLKIPQSLRRKGLIISYDNGTEFIYEEYISTTFTNYWWGNNVSWKRVNYNPNQIAALENIGADSLVDYFEAGGIDNNQNSRGQDIDAPGMMRSNYVQVTEGTSYLVYCTSGTSDYLRIAGYDSNKNYATNFNISTGTDGKTPITITIPTGTAYIRISNGAYSGYYGVFRSGTKFLDRLNTIDGQIGNINSAITILNTDNTKNKSDITVLNSEVGVRNLAKTWHDGSINAQGIADSTATDWRYSDFFEVEGGALYKLRCGSYDSAVSSIAYYSDSNENAFISRISFYYNRIFKIESPSNAKYVRVCYKKAAGQNDLNCGLFTIDDSFIVPLKAALVPNYFERILNQGSYEVQDNATLSTFVYIPVSDLTHLGLSLKTRDDDNKWKIRVSCYDANFTWLRTKDFSYNYSWDLEDDVYYIQLALQLYDSSEVQVSPVELSKLGYGEITVDTISTKDIKDRIDETSILNLNPRSEYDNTILNAVKKKFYRNSPGSIKDVVTFLHFSDNHTSVANCKRVMEFYKRYEAYIDDIINTGDLVNGDYEESFSFWNECGLQKCLIALGNHDVWLYGNHYDPATEEYLIEGFFESSTTTRLLKPIYCYNKYLAPNISSWGVVQPSDAATTGKSYYYKDYTYTNGGVTSTTLRAIVLDAFHLGVYSDLDENQNSIQNEWLETVLADALSNHIPVAIFVHYRPALLNYIGCSYNSVDNPDESILPESVLNTVKNFIDDGGEFVAWFVGHSHKDSIGTFDDGRQVVIAITCARNPNEDMSDDDGARVMGTKSQDAFNILSIDTNEKTIKIVRVGADYNRHLQRKRNLVYRYADYDGKQAGLVLCY